MSKKGSGKNRLEAILMDIQAGSKGLVGELGLVRKSADYDTMQDLRDDELYTNALQHAELMQSLPDEHLRGHLPVLIRLMRQARSDDRSHTAGDAVRKVIDSVSDSIKLYGECAHELMGQIDSGDGGAE